MVKNSESGANRVVIIGVSVFCLVVALAGAAFWQRSVHNSNLDSAGTHSATAALVQQAEGEGATVGQLLQQYVASGDPALLPEIDTHTKAGVKHLSAATTSAGGDPQGFLDKGTKLVQAAGQVIAQRQSGDIQAAAATLTALSPQFQAFIGEQNAFVTTEQQQAAADTQNATDANDMALWLAIAATVLACTGIVTGVAYARGAFGRRLNTAPTA